ncbi:sensor histidine kinase, partial [uncultured Amnibacterium sp.]|uniref:sensor histidine kinase n=1 Tax=uncultured Amnibacterium sp. TaxID=1631851 RepID=UPI0035CA9533
EWSRHRNGGRFELGPPRDELTGLAAVLDDLLDRVEDALAAERRLTAEIAHELRTPLTILVGEADLALMQRSAPARERARFERIRSAATAMTRAVTALLDESEVAAAGTAEVRDAVEAALATLPGRAPAAVDGAATVAVPPEHLERILAPILDNATRLAATAVRVRIRPGDEVVVEIEDDGPGVDPAVEESLFDPGVTTRSDGTGLGLALSRRLARRVDGDVRLTRGRPATFEVRLPSAASVADPGLRSDPGRVAAG